MPISPFIEVHLHNLTHPRLLRWDESGVLPCDTTGMRRGREEDIRQALAREYGASLQRSPIVQLKSLLEPPMEGSIPAAGLGVVGEALETLSQEVLDLRDGSPHPRGDRMESYFEVRGRVIMEQLACWKVAVYLSSKDPTGRHQARLDWPAGLPPSHPFLEYILLDEKKGFVDGHVHLGGVLGTMDYWLDVLDPRSQDRHLPGGYHWFRIGSRSWLPPHVLRRWREARDIRDMLTVALVVAKRLNPGIDAPQASSGLRWYPRTCLGSLTPAMYERILGKAEEAIFKNIGLEGALRSEGRPQSVSSEDLAMRLVERPLVPLILSPWFRDDVRQDHRYDPLLHERRFLVAAFTGLLSQDTGLPRWFAPLLKVYLVAQNIFHAAVTQQGQRPGLGQFLEWYDSPFRNADRGNESYRKLRVLNRATRDGSVRLEGRVTPDPARIRGWLRAFDTLREERGAVLGRDLGLVVHFIKEPDRPSSPAPATYASSVEDAPFLRHAQLRGKIRTEAFALERYRDTQSAFGQGVIGVDAARDECDTPPEVFAPAFRYLRRHAVAVADVLSRPGGRVARHLKATFHAGESFRHPLTGLRTVHEALHFLPLMPGDRIGHGLTLGMDVEKWQAHSGPIQRLTREERLDNLVWMYVFLADTEHCGSLYPLIEDAIAREFAVLYGGAPAPGHHRLVDLLSWAWRLRWMDPIHLFGILDRLGWSNGEPPKERMPRASQLGEPSRSDRFAGHFYSCDARGECLITGERKQPTRFSCNQGSMATCTAVRDLSLNNATLTWRLCTVDLGVLFSGNVPLASLNYLWRYHFDRAYRRRGAALVSWDEEGLPDWQRVFPALQQRVLMEVKERGITVELCPSSNGKIGALASMTEHPIFRLDTTHLPREHGNGVRVSVNTDDPGIFATNLIGEYDLLARAAEARGNSQTEVEKWIRHLRDQSMETTFLERSTTTAPSGDAEDRDSIRRWQERARSGRVLSIDF